MKYEMIFGDQSLFDGGPKDAEMVGYALIDLRFYKVLESAVYFYRDEKWCLADNNYPGASPIAMRRIIPEPKRWTVEDQKAGRLPEVDCVVRATGIDEDARIAAINNDSVCVVFEDGAFVTLHVSGIAPIETPEEKAQREEGEFVKSEMKNTTLSMEWSCVYERGLRAAYRKLKGGE